jgi:hypothetical protein
VAFLFLEFEPVVDDFAGEVAEEGGVGAQQVERSVVVLWLCLEVQEVLFPQRFVVAVGDEGAFVERAEEVGVARLPHEGEVAPPGLDVAAEGPVLVQLRQPALELVSLLHVPLRRLVQLPQLHSQQSAHFPHVSLRIALSWRQPFLLRQLPQHLERQLIALSHVGLR